MLKVFGFVRRNANLTHDEYRAAHVGYHNSYGRRLNNIRGYLLNVRANRDLGETIGAPLLQQISWGEPAQFDAEWDGWGQLLFDSLEDYLAARSPAIDRAGPDGLELDPMVAKVGDDFDYLYAGSPFQFHVDEHVAQAVIRPERKLFKLVQFAKCPTGMAPELFRAMWTGRYASHLTTMPGLRGLIMNLRTPLDVMTGFFAPDAEGFTAAGTQIRETFYSHWDAMAEFWIDRPEDFAAGRTLLGSYADFAQLERELLASCFYREVDETVAVLPNRRPRPDFYFR
ncbi:MAG: hypothetical protein ACR2PZ_20105 [Pseudomonadales bacterium]